MKMELLPKLKCVNCGGKLAAHEETSDKNEIRTGQLACQTCNRTYPIRNGVIDLLPENIHTLLKAEKEGWINRAKAKNWYEATDEYLLSLPYPKQSNEEVDWENGATQFYYLVDKAFTDWQGKTALDIGVGKPWTSRHLAKKGAHVIATDILEDDKIGLGVADLYMRNDGTYFERVLSDMNALPFQDGTMDVVLYQGALHHSLDLWKSLTEADRVLKKKGHIILSNEGNGGIFSRESVGKPTEDGINEHNYKNIRYVYYLKKLGYKVRTYQYPTFYDKHGNNAIPWLLHEFWRFVRGGQLLLVAEKVG
ncbi:methyltransferase domain-containing protein [Candidatus Micrarchaeota archaeon]|nr:methyltransferase domain-containing protein [Candidatus Micrarchaeota archaeon]